MPRVLLLLPTSTYRAPDFMGAAAAMGVDVVVGSEAAPAMGAMGDRAVVLPLCDPPVAVAAIEALHRRSPLDAVVAVDDQGVVVAALAAERLGLRHNPPAAVAATRDKTAMRAAFAAAGVPQPAFRVVAGELRDGIGRSGTDSVPRLEDAVVAVGLPCVVKPVSLSGSRGVIRADSVDEAVAAAARIRAILRDAGEDPEGLLLVEAFVPGAEVAVEGLLDGGRLDVLAVFDKPDPLDGPYFEETLYVTPSRLGVDVVPAVAAACDALGLREGPVHAEARVGADGSVTVLEVAARSIGGLCGRALRFGAGLSLEEVILRHALGLPVSDLRRERVASGVMMLPIPRSGALEGVDGLDAARAVEGVVGVEITVPRGQKVVALPEGDRYLGFAFAKGETADDVEDALRRAHAALGVRIA